MQVGQTVVLGVDSDKGISLLERSSPIGKGPAVPKIEWGMARIVGVRSSSR